MHRSPIFVWGLGFRVILGLYSDNGKENGNYYVIIGDILGYDIVWSFEGTFHMQLWAGPQCEPK